MMPAYDPGQGSGGTLFFIGDNFTLYAVDPATGMNRVSPVGVGEVHGNMAIANGLIFLNNGSSGVKVLDETTLHTVTTLQPAHAGLAFSGLAVAHGFVYWLSGSYLNAWSLPAP